MKTAKCLYCKKEFQYHPSSSGGRFCSKSCYNKFRHENRKFTKCICDFCGKEFLKRISEIRRSKHNYCSAECSNKRFLNPENNPRWNNGRRTYNNYYALLRKNHPNADHAGYVYEHRLVMEERLGRYLTKEEVVHHINENKKDNRIKNLMLFANDTLHKNYHKKLRDTT